MKQVAAYTIVEEGEERFFTVLECGCTYHVVIESLFDPDLPCPVHEEHRFTGDKPDDRPHVQT